MVAIDGPAVRVRKEILRSVADLLEENAVKRFYRGDYLAGGALDVQAAATHEHSIAFAVEGKLRQPRWRASPTLRCAPSFQEPWIRFRVYKMAGYVARNDQRNVFKPIMNALRIWNTAPNIMNAYTAGVGAINTSGNADSITTVSRHAMLVSRGLT